MIVIGFILFGFGAWDGMGVFGDRHELVGRWADVGIAGVGGLIIIACLLRLVGGRT